MKYIRIILLISLLFQQFSKILCQQSKNQTWNIGLDGGLINYTLSDNLFNYYTYKGNKFQNADLHLNLSSDSNIFSWNVMYGKATLLPDVDLSTYKYNNLNYSDVSFSFEYLHNFFSIENGLNIFFGASYNLQFTDKLENYKSTLWTYAEGYKECGEVTYVKFLINASINYHIYKYFFLFHSGYAFFNYSGRANDSFTGLYNKIYSINNYINYQFTLTSYREISKHLNLKIAFSKQYENYSYRTDFRILKNTASIGITYKF